MLYQGSDAIYYKESEQLVNPGGVGCVTGQDQ